MTYRDDGALKIYDETTQTWTDIPLPAVFSTTDYFTLGDTIATIKDYILYLYVPNVDRVIRKPSTIQNLPNQIRRRGELYLRDNLNWIIGSNRGRTWDTIRYSSPSSLTSQGSYSYSAKNDILFFCNDFEAFDIGDPAQPLEAVRFMQNEDHYRIVRPINDEAFVSRIRGKTVVNLHVASGSITNRINAINLNTARIEARNQTVIATWPEGIRIQKDDGSSRVTLSIDLQPESLQCIGDTCVFVSASEELYMSKDAGENWAKYSIPNILTLEADALILQPDGMYVGQTALNSEVSIFYHDFASRNTTPVAQIDWRDIVSRPSFRIANYNLWITKNEIYRVEDNTGDLELLPDTNFPFITYSGDRELVRVSNLVERGDSIIATGGNMKRPFVSIDRGESWTEWAGPLPSGNVNDAILVGGRLLLATSNGLFIEPGGISGLSETKTSSVARAVCFPNPAAVGQVIQIELPAGTKTESHASIAVLSTDGRLVAAEQDYPTTNGQVTVSGIQQAGSYCIIGEVGGHWFSSMVVIK